MDQATKVREANKQFYEVVASDYDKIDSRRQQPEQPWLKDILQKNRNLLEQDFSEPLQFLDAGAGSGYLSRSADGIFPIVSALDISPAMLSQLKPLRHSLVHKLEGSCESIPAADNYFHMVGAFATLHHLYSPQVFFQEAYRVLKPGGILYTDHDISKEFVDRFRLPLKLYRYFFDHGHKYLAQFPTLTEESYQLSEFHGEHGLSAEIVENCKFRETKISWHWQGSGVPGTVLQAFRGDQLLARKGLAPMLRIWARK